MTDVISVRGCDRKALLADPTFVYVGRQCAGWSESIWANPFKRGMSPREALRIMESLGPHAGRYVVTEAARDEEMTTDDLLACYQGWLHAQPDLMGRLPELRGKTLGCWCKCWKPGQPEIQCHAYLLAQAANKEDPMKLRSPPSRHAPVIIHLPDGYTAVCRGHCGSLEVEECPTEAEALELAERLGWIKGICVKCQERTAMR